MSAQAEVLAEASAKASAEPLELEPLRRPCAPHAAQNEPEVRMTPASEDEIVRALWQWGGMKTSAVPRLVSATFGAWMLERLPVERWSKALAARGWDRWQRLLMDGSPAVPEEAREAFEEWQARLARRASDQSGESEAP